MLVATQGIVFSYTKYSENSVIVKIFTCDFGLQTFFLRGLGKKKNKQLRSCLQPLSVVEVEFVNQPNKNLMTLKTIKNQTPYIDIPLNIFKSSIVFFLAEILSKTIKEEEPNQQLFYFISNSLIDLDNKTNGYANFHLFFLAQLVEKLGFQPHLETYKNNSYFNLQEGVFMQQPSMICLNTIESELFYQLFVLPENQTLNFKITSAERKKLISALLDYFSCHIQNLSNLKTREVLEEIFS
ncbi:MAG: DNA repair protein RecO [Flavobacteriales bacterium]|nr:DNA repair protein RecO [Flavobacteriales bacterium]